MTGNVSAESVSRTVIQKMLAHSPALASQMNAIRTMGEDGPLFHPDLERVWRVIVKIARAHAAYELHEHFEEDPISVRFFPLPVLSVEQREGFERPAGGMMWPEVGSRAMQRLVEGYPGKRPGWVDVQEGRYRYMVAIGDGRIVRMVMSEYLGCEVVWDF